MSPICPLVGPVTFNPPLCSVGDPLDGKGDIANTPICGPLLFSSLLDALGAPHLAGLCSQSANLWAYSDFLPLFEALGTP